VIFVISLKDRSVWCSV